MRRLSLVILAFMPVLQAAAAEPSAVTGKTLYNEKYMCYTCHGYSGENGPGARLVPMKMTRQVFVAYVRNPRQPNRMPSFSAKVVSDAELGDIYAYIQSLPDSSPDPKTLPLLNDLLK